MAAVVVVVVVAVQWSSHVMSETSASNHLVSRTIGAVVAVTGVAAVAVVAVQWSSHVMSETSASNHLVSRTIGAVVAVTGVAAVVVVAALPLLLPSLSFFGHVHRSLRDLSTRHGYPHTPSIAFRHLPPNSATFGYATEGALFISAQLSTDAVSALRKVRVLI